MIHLQLDRDIEERLEALGATSDTSKVALAKETLLSALKDDTRDLKLAEERLAKPGRRWSQEELERELDLVD
ncbi:MAG: anti-toxin [Acidobacteriota bacterium]